MRISVEIVPRGEAEVLADARTVREAIPYADTVNVPDLVRFPLRAWDACALSRRHVMNAIPHLRAIDVPPGDAVPAAAQAEALGLTEILVVRGDPPRDLSRRTYPTDSAEVIRRVRAHHPGLKVYAGLDPYRAGFADELASVSRKLDAGATGLFTQPVFDVRLIGLWAGMLPGVEVFWGISPVLGDRSRSYWETTNRVVFPRLFSPTMHWNVRFAQDALAAADNLGGNAYLMPIRTDLRAYLEGVSRGLL